VEEFRRRQDYEREERKFQQVIDKKIEDEKWRKEQERKKRELIESKAKQQQ
jgi:hypothetical protein